MADLELTKPAAEQPPGAAMSDEYLLLTRAAQGDRAAFDELMDLHQASVYRFCLFMLGDEAQAADTTQDVFLKVFRAAGRYRPTASFNTWLMRIARNACLNELRRRRRHPTTPLERENRGGQTVPVQIAAPEAARPDSRAEAAERSAAVRRAVGNLPPDQRTVVSLAKLGGLSYEEISKVTGKSVPAIKSLMHRAKLALAEALADYV